MSKVKLAVASVLLLAATACTNKQYHDGHTHLPIVSTTPKSCHWVYSIHDQKQRRRINGKMRTVTIRVRSKSLICHY